MSEHQEADVLETLKKIQQQLVYLEKKIDTLINQRPAQESRPPFQKDRGFQKPFRPYGRSNSDRGPREYGNREHGSHGHGNHSERPSHFNKQREHGGQGYGHKKKPFYARHER